MAYTCPHCGRDAVGTFRKLVLGQLRPVPCRRCGEKVVVSAWGLALVMVVVAASALASWFYEYLGPVGASVVVGAALLAAVVLHLEAVPLAPYRRSRVLMVAALGVLCAMVAVPAAGVPLGIATARYLPPPASLPVLKETEHFAIHTNLGPGELEHCARFFEGFVGEFERRYFPVEQRRRLRMFLFADAASYRAWVRERYPSYSPYGFYLNRSNVIVVNLESGLGTATHELVHHFVAVAFREPPPTWVNEGFATFFEKFIARLDQYGRLEISLGYFSNWRFPATKRRVEKLSLAELAASEDVDQCAARSLALFLHRGGLLERFVDRVRVARGAGDCLGLLEEVCGKPRAEVEREWKDWVRAQPLDADVLLVPRAFCKNPQEWDAWWAANRERLYLDEELGIYRVR
jgi:hypothetical protein